MKWIHKTCRSADWSMYHGKHLGACSSKKSGREFFQPCQKSSLRILKHHIGLIHLWGFFHQDLCTQSRMELGCTNFSNSDPEFQTSSALKVRDCHRSLYHAILWCLEPECSPLLELNSGTKGPYRIAVPWLSCSKYCSGCQCRKNYLNLFLPWIWVRDSISWVLVDPLPISTNNLRKSQQVLLATSL